MEAAPMVRVPVKDAGSDPATNGVGKSLVWLFGQPAYIVLLTGILAAIGYGAWYGVPAAVSQIQEGYQQLDARHAEERKEFRADAKEVRDGFGRAVEKFETAIGQNTRALERLSDRIDAKQ